MQVRYNGTVTTRVPVKPGDRVTVQGDLVDAHGKRPIVHWTHHDPGHRHADGFIEFGGRMYA